MFNRRCRYEYGKPYVHPSIEAAKTSREDNTPLLFGMFRAPLRLRKAPRPKSPPLSKNRGSTADTNMIREPVLRCLSPPSIRCVKGIFPSEPWKTREVFSAGTTEWSSGTTFSILPQLLSRPESSTESIQQRKPPPTERSATTGARQSCISDDVSAKTVTDDVSAVVDDVFAVVDDVSAAIDDRSADVSAKTVVDDVITVPYDDNVSVQIEGLDAEAEQTVGGTEASIILTSASVSQVTTRPELEGDKETPLEQDGEQQKHTIDPAQSKRSGSAGKRTEGSSGRKAGYEGDDETSAWESYESCEVSIASQRSSAASVEAAASVDAASRNASSCSILSANSAREASGVESGPEGDTSRVDTSQDKDTSSQDKDTSSPEMSITGRETSSELPVALEIRDGYFDETSRRESYEEFMSRRHSVGDPEDPVVIKESHFDEHMRRRSYEEYIMRRMSEENAIWKTYSYISKPLDNTVESDNSDSVDSSRGFSFPFFIPRSCTSASQFVKRSGYPSRRSVIDGKAEKVSAVKLVKRKRHTTVSDIVKACDRMYINDILSRQLYHGNLFWARMAGVTTDETLRRKNLKVRIVTSGYEPFFPGGKFKESVTNLDRKRSKQPESSERKSISDQASLQDQNKATRSSVDRSSINDEFRRRSSATGQSQEVSEISDQLLLDQIAIKMQSSVDQSDTTADLLNQSPIQQPFTAEQSDKPPEVLGQLPCDQSPIQQPFTEEQSDKQTADLRDQSSIQQPFTAKQSDKPPELFDQSSREQPPAAEQSDKPTAEMSDRSSTKRQSTTEQSFSRNEADEQTCSGPQSFDDKESSLADQGSSKRSEASPEPTHLTSLSKPMAVSDFPPLNPLYFADKRPSLPVPLIHLKHPAGRPRSLSTPLALYQNQRGQTMPGELDPSEVRGESSRTPGVLKYTNRESDKQSYVVEEFHSPRPPASTPEPMPMKPYTPFVAGFKYWNRWVSNVAKEPGAYCGNAFLELSVPRPTSPVLWKYDRVNRV